MSFQSFRAILIGRYQMKYVVLKGRWHTSQPVCASRPTPYTAQNFVENNIVHRKHKSGNFIVSKPRICGK